MAWSRDSSRCPDTTRLLSRHLEGEFDRSLCDRLAKHVRDCPDCLNTCESLKSTLRLCGSFGEAAAPVAVRIAVGRALEAGGW